MGEEKSLDSQIVELAHKRKWKALVGLAEKVAEDRWSVLLRRQYAEALIKLNRETEAVEQLSNLAFIYEELGQPGKTTATLKRIVERTPENWLLQIRYARSLAQSGFYREAIDICETIINRYEDDIGSSEDGSVVLEHLLSWQPFHEKGRALLRQLDPDHPLLLVENRILVVDDDEDIRFFLEQVLSDFSAEVVGFEDAESALMYTRNNPPAAYAFVDYEMPGMKGLELIELWRTMEKTAYMSVVFMSAYTHATTMIRSLQQEQNIRLVLAKPFSPEVVRREMARLTGHSLRGVSSVPVKKTPEIVAHKAGSILIVGEKKDWANDFYCLLDDVGFQIRQHANLASLSDMEPAMLGLLIVPPEIPVETQLIELENLQREHPGMQKTGWVVVHTHPPDGSTWVPGKGVVRMLPDPGSAQVMFQAIRDLISTQTHPARKVLIALADQEEALEMQGWLAEEGFLTLVVDNPYRTIEKAESWVPDVILSDLRFPQASGLEIARLVRLNPRLLDVEVVFLTAVADNELCRDAFEAGGDIVIEKPTEQSMLTALLAQVNRRIDHREDLFARDPLTGVYLRSAGYAHMGDAERKFRDAADTGVIMLDADHFKKVNDSYGHQVGDMVLRRIGAILQTLLGSDDTAIRWGGEEFVVLLANSDGAMLQRWLEDLLNAVRGMKITVPDPYSRGATQTLIVTVSAGGALLSQASGSSEGAIQMADEEMYKAKGAGRDRYCIRTE